MVITTVSVPVGAQDPSVFDAGADNQMGLTFSPDGNTAFWVEWDGKWGSRGGQRVIYTAERRNGTWTKPSPAPFTAQHSDDDPFVSPDGQWLYFVTDRPTTATDDDRDTNIWRYSLVHENRLEHLSVNSAAAEYSPVMTSSGALYFASARDGGPGQGDIYRAAAQGNGFGPAESLGPSVNSEFGEWNVWVSPDETELVFEASSRQTNVSEAGDLYYTWHTPAGWTAAVSVGRLNSADSDLMPRLHPAGERLYFTTAPIGGNARIATADWREMRSRLRENYAPILLVANRSSHEVTFVDLSRGAVVGRIATGEGPHLLSNVSNGRVLATGYGVFPRPHEAPASHRPPFIESLNSRATLIDISMRSAISDWVITDCDKPHASWIVGQRAYVTCETRRRVAVIDLETGRALGSLGTRQDGSHVLGFAPRLRILAVSNTDSGSVSLIEIDSGETRVVELAGGSEGSLVINGQVWVGNAWDGSVSVVDIRTAAMSSKIESVCDFPISLSQGRQQVWLACFGSAELVSIDTDSFAIGRRISLEDQPLNLLLHRNSRLAYVSLPRQNAVAEIDLESGEELRRIDVGIEPDGLRWAH